MEGKISKKELTTLVIGVISLVVLTIGATFAYFQVAVTDTSGTTTITGDIGGATLGTVTLTGGDTELYLGISPYDMSESKKGTTYYSSTTEGSRETSKASAGKTTYTATLSGDTTDTVMYACDYEFTVTATGSMLGKSGGAELIFEGDINKTLNFDAYYENTQKLSGTFRKITSSNPKKEFNAYLKLDNTNYKQNSLAGTNLSVEIENTEWSCYLLDDSDLIGDAYALRTEITKDGLISENLYFVRSETPISVGELHNGERVTYVSRVLEDASYFYNEIPWRGIYDEIIFEDEIRPINTSNWFSGVSGNLDLTNLNTSLVTDMSGMFSYRGGLISGLETLDVSNVTDMSNMFEEAMSDLDGISNWDVSNVTDMSWMFCMYSGTQLDLGGWDVSSVTNMSGMFQIATALTSVGDISGWNTSNVTDMSGMFQGTAIGNLDLSGWNVKKVVNYSDFSTSDTLTPPNFGQTA